jgi:outer membrane protein OmpA-like peptidoglycan-associated protein
MKKLILLVPALYLFSVANAQILKKIADKAKQKVEQRADQKTDKAMEDGLDKAEGKSKNKTTDATTKDETVVADETKSKTTPPGLQAYSKYDFVQGEKVIAFEDFSRVNAGDFPTAWNTNGSAEVVTLNNKEGKWLRVNTGGFFYPEFIKSIPENSTLEFDLGVNPDFKWATSNFYMYITNLEDKSKFSSTGYFGPYFEMEFHPMTGDAQKSGGVRFGTGNTSSTIHNSAGIKNWNHTDKNFVHISLWRQGTRLRMYANGDKIFDLPRALEANGKYADVMFYTYNSFQEPDFYVLSNIRLAAGAPDTRNKLISEGRFVTSGISFDVNSDKLKPESYGVLKQIADALTENPDVKVKIIGHTDSDGDDAKNLDLSKRRAAAVKTALASEFKIDVSRLETDGMGETKPVAANTTTEGKAENRRVEFVKI